MKEEGRGKKEEGRGKKEEGKIWYYYFIIQTCPFNYE
jgi:hypothetical protein